jgi:membrane protein YdbS with pleckstrin-like domain
MELQAAPSFDPAGITRPDSKLMHYYLLVALMTGPLFPITILPLAFKYHTLRYRFDEDGVSMSWGALWRKETHLTYRRIQDIHLTRGLLQRWTGLATVAIQTASGSAGPEMSIEGILAAAPLRDFLYARMRGVRDATKASVNDSSSPAGDTDEALTLLRDIRDLLQRKNDSEGGQV